MVDFTNILVLTFKLAIYTLFGKNKIKFGQNIFASPKICTPVHLCFAPSKSCLLLHLCSSLLTSEVQSSVIANYFEAFMRSTTVVYTLLPISHIYQLITDMLGQGREPIAREPDVAFLITASCSLDIFCLLRMKHFL